MFKAIVNEIKGQYKSYKLSRKANKLVKERIEMLGGKYEL